MITEHNMADGMHRVKAMYCERTHRSASLFQAARNVLPGGDTRTVTHFEPHPLFMESGAGCKLTDVDNNQYLDFLNNYTALVHGHAHPKITDAVFQQLQKGTCYASPIELQTMLAEVLSRRVPGIEHIRFCNSGTEATMSAVRLAKAYTRRNKVIKMEGGYHGSHDMAQISVKPSLTDAGPARAPNSVPEGPGIFRGVLTDVVVAPFNDVDDTSRIVDLHHNDLAAIIVEPVLGSPGVIPARPEYLKFLREVTRSCDAVLIFDEIVTFRLAYGGAQEIYGITPDLTTLGKIIGGGFPVGAFGGRAEIMDLLDPRRGKLTHSGTFNGNAITLTAGLACLELLTEVEIERINHLGERLREAFRGALLSAGIAGQICGLGSLASVHFAEREVIDYRSAAEGVNRQALQALHLSLLNGGVFPAPRGEFCISTPMGEWEVDQAGAVFRSALEAAVPYLDPRAKCGAKTNVLQST
jgi:glutamate-1-semialdehyde 2,1-aminomutase